MSVDPQIDGEAVPVDPPTWKRDFPYQAAAEEEVTRREFARYLALGAGALAVGNVGLAAWTQLRSINVGEPRAVVALADVEVGGTFLFRYPENADPAILLARRRHPGRRVQSEVHASRLRRLLPADGSPMALPVPRRQLSSH